MPAQLPYTHLKRTNVILAAMRPRLSLLSLFPALALLTALAPPASSNAQEVQRIAAIVNDEVISAYDLESRMRLALFSTRLPNTPDVRRRILQQVLRSLIDEKLQLQEARRHNISVSRRELSRATESIEGQNGIPRGKMDEFLGRNGVPKDAMSDQIRATIAWNKLLGRRIRPRITIGEDEIDEVLDRIKTRQGQTEYRIGEIALSVDSPDEEARVRSTAERIAEQIRKGANFAAIARQFSESPTAAVGGDLGWIHEAELDPSLSKAVPNLRRGEMSPPIKTVSGYRIVALLDSRKIAVDESTPETVDLRQIFLPVSEVSRGGAFAAQIDLARTLSEIAENCSDFERLAKEAGSPRRPTLGKLEVANLSSTIRGAIQDVPAGKISAPIQLPDGVLLLMVCNRAGGSTTIKLPPRRDIADQLLRNRLTLMARRYLRDLRLSAVIDIRI